MIAPARSVVPADGPSRRGSDISAMLPPQLKRRPPPSTTRGVEQERSQTHSRASSTTLATTLADSRASSTDAASSLKGSQGSIATMVTHESRRVTPRDAHASPTLPVEAPVNPVFRPYEPSAYHPDHARFTSYVHHRASSPAYSTFVSLFCWSGVLIFYR
jgi:hypothetical protein